MSSISLIHSLQYNIISHIHSPYNIMVGTAWLTLWLFTAFQFVPTMIDLCNVNVIYCWLQDIKLWWQPYGELSIVKWPIRCLWPLVLWTKQLSRDLTFYQSLPNRHLLQVMPWALIPTKLIPFILHRPSLKLVAFLWIVSSI